jgi:hypothetical protein
MNAKKWIAVCVVYFTFVAHVWAKPAQIQAVSVMGAVEYQKKSQGKWSPVRVGSRLTQKDQLKTGVESTVELQMEDGSKISINENSIVQMTFLNTDNGVGNTKMQVKRGSLLFNIQKLATNSKMEFETVTATAAIRGTIGGIGSNKDGSTGLFLREGKVELRTSSGQKKDVVSGQFVLQKKDGSLAVFNTKNPQKLFTTVQKIIENDDGTLEENLDDVLESLAQEVEQGEPDSSLVPADSLQADSLQTDSLQVDSLLTDSAMVDSLAPNSGDSVVVDSVVTDTIATAMDTVAVATDTLVATPDTVATVPDTVVQNPEQVFGDCKLNGFPAETYEPSLTLTGSCPDGTVIKTGNTKTTAKGGSWALQLFWPAQNNYGVKQFELQCEYPNGVSKDCGSVAVEYVKRIIPLQLQLNTPTSVQVCKGPLVLAGSYLGTDARLVARAGTKEYDLTSTNGAFSKTIPISDRDNNWDLSFVELVLSNGEGQESERIDVDVDKSCKEVNKNVPTLTTSVTEKTCSGVWSAEGTRGGDELQLVLEAGGIELENRTFTTDQRAQRFTMLAGINDYRFVVEDLAGNRVEKKIASAACYPEINLRVSVDGPRREILRVPPPPPNKIPQYKKRIRFVLDNVPENDPGYVTKIEIKLNNQVVQNYTGIQIDRLEYEMDLVLKRNMTNVVQIEVTQVSGKVERAFKEYDFR